MPSYDRCPTCKCSIILTTSEDERKCFLCGTAWKLSDPVPAPAPATEPDAKPPQ